MSLFVRRQSLPHVTLCVFFLYFICSVCDVVNSNEHDSSNCFGAYQQFQFDMSQVEQGRVAATCDVSNDFIVMSRGRSGSEYEMDFLSKVLNNNKVEQYFLEILGSNSNVMNKTSNPLDIIQKFFCSDHKKQKFVGFKWKPYVWNEGLIKALHWVAYNKIPVIFNVRNPIDEILSALKHRDGVPSNESRGKRIHLFQHCKAGKNQAECVEQQMQAQLVNVPPHIFLRYLNDLSCLTTYTKYLLDFTGVRHFDVEFEKVSLEHSSNNTVIRTWRQVLSFLDPSRPWQSIVDMKLLNASTTMVATSSPRHRDKIKNYDEISMILQGTRFAPFLN